MLLRLLIASVVLTGGCASMDATVRKRAAVDLSCSADDLQFRDRVYGVYLVAGCGKQASYRCQETAGLDVVCERFGKGYHMPRHEDDEFSLAR